MPVRRRSNPIAWTKLHPAGRLCRPSRGFLFVKGKKRMTNGNTDDKNYKITGQAAKTAARAGKLGGSGSVCRMGRVVQTAVFFPGGRAAPQVTLGLVAGQYSLYLPEQGGD